MLIVVEPNGNGGQLSELDGMVENLGEQCHLFVSGSRLTWKILGFMSWQLWVPFPLGNTRIEQ